MLCIFTGETSRGKILIRWIAAAAVRIAFAKSQSVECKAVSVAGTPPAAFPPVVALTIFSTYTCQNNTDELFTATRLRPGGIPA